MFSAASSGVCFSVCICCLMLYAVLNVFLCVVGLSSAGCCDMCSAVCSAVPSDLS